MIDLAKIVQQAVGTVGANVKDVVKTVTYKHLSAEGTYDPVTGETGSTFTNYTITTALLTSFKFNERSVNSHAVEAGDQKLLIPYADLPITPTVKDLVVIGGETWTVANFATDPTKTALHTIQIKRA